MKKLFLRPLAALAPLCLANTAHAWGTFGLFTEAGCCHKCKSCCNSYPQANAFTPPCCGYMVAPPGTYAPAGVDGAFTNGSFGCGKAGRCKWGHRKEAGSCSDCGDGGYSMGGAGFDGAYAMGEEGQFQGETGVALDGTGMPMNGNPIIMGHNPLDLKPGEQLVGDVMIDGQVVTPGNVALPGQRLQPQPPAFIPGSNSLPAQQYMAPPAARPMMPPASMNMTFGAIQQTGYTPNYTPIQPNYNPYYRMPAYGYMPYPQQVPYYWNTLGGGR